MPPLVDSLVERALVDLASPTLVLSDVDPPPPASGATWVRIGTTTPKDSGWASVVLAVSDVSSLRRAVSVLPPLGRARTVVCLVADSARPVSLMLRPEWPPLVSLDARVTPAGGAITTVRFAKRVAVGDVLVELARSAGLPVVTGNSGLVTALLGGLPGDLVPPPVDSSTLVVRDLADAGDAEREVPPDVVVRAGSTSDGSSSTGESHPVTGRPPVVIETSDELAIGPLDEALLNPRGFRISWGRGVVDLDPHAVVTPGLVERLRDAQGVRVTWPGDRQPESVGAARAVAGLAMAGVPLVTDRITEQTRAMLGEELSNALTQDADLDEPLRREEHSIRVRRAALKHHSTLAWRTRVAAIAGVRHAAYPLVSILLATRRPERLDFALRQVSKQRGPDVELVLAAHGFDPDPARVRDALGDRPHTILSLPADTLFGDVLRAATDAAGGDVVLKMDDDDWYGPDVVTDLLLARHYTGAELVGMPAEFVFLEPIWTMIRRRGGSETHAAVVAGGTMMIDRPLLRGIGGFRSVRRFVDAQLLASVRAAGGSIYRTQGLGYVLRRTSAGHTWETGLGYFLTRRSLANQWRGFQPSRLLEYDAFEVPHRPQGECNETNSSEGNAP